MKFITLLISFLVICSLTACSVENIPTNTIISSERPSVATQGATDIKYPPFSVVKSGAGYMYRIYDDNTLVEENYSVREPKIHYVTDTMIYITVQTGTGKSTNWGVFYDYESNLRSNTFYWVLDFTDEIVVIGHKDRLVLCSIFDDTYYKEITNFTYPIAQVADGIVSAELTDDRNTVVVTYIIADSYDIITEHIEIRTS